MKEFKVGIFKEVRASAVVEPGISHLIQDTSKLHKVLMSQNNILPLRMFEFA